MVGSMNSESFHTYHAFANTFHLPLITPWSKEASEIKVAQQLHAIQEQYCLKS